MKSIAAVLIFLFLVSCGSIRVQYDYDKETDFSSYTTYNYYQDLDTGLSELDAKRLLKALDATLRLKGFLLSEEPEFFINIESSLGMPNRNTVDLGIGGTGRSVGGGISIGVPVGASKEQRVIQFDFIDSQKDALFWQAISRSSFKENSTPEERERILQELVNKVLSKYPPKHKK
ncbi:MAG: DUF4136 domain-containing protein [Cellulophaga sp.]